MITNDVSTCPKCGGDLKYYAAMFGFDKLKEALSQIHK